MVSGQRLQVGAKALEIDCQLESLRWDACPMQADIDKRCYA